MKNRFILKLISLSFIFLSGTSVAATTSYGKIVGIETRAWGLHIQTDFGFSMEVCEAVVGETYMYDFVYTSDRNSSESASVEISIIMAAFAAKKDIAFHIYECNSTRPKVGFILLK